MAFDNPIEKFFFWGQGLSLAGIPKDTFSHWISENSNWKFIRRLKTRTKFRLT